MILDITAPADTTDMDQFHTAFQNAKTALSERMEGEAVTGESTPAHNDHDSADFGIHVWRVPWTRTHADYNALVNYTPRVNGSLHYVTSLGEFYTVEGGDLVQLTFLDHATQINLDGTLHDDHYFSRETSVALEGDATIAEEGSIVPTAQTHDDNSDPLDPAHLLKTQYEAHGANSIVDANLDDDTCYLSSAGTVYTNSLSSVDVHFGYSQSNWSYAVDSSVVCAYPAGVGSIYPNRRLFAGVGSTPLYDTTEVAT